MYDDSMLPSQHPSLLWIIISIFQMRILRLEEMKVTCSGSQNQKLVELDSNPILLPSFGHTIAMFFNLCVMIH